MKFPTTNNILDCEGPTFEYFLNECKTNSYVRNRLLPSHFGNVTEYTKQDICELYDNYQYFRNNDVHISTYFDRLYEFLTQTLKPDYLVDKLSWLPGCVDYDIDPTEAVVLLFDSSVVNLDNYFSQEDQDLIRHVCLSHGYVKRAEYIDKFGYFVMEFAPNYTKEVTDQVYHEYNGQLIEPCVVWHLCRKDVYDKKIKGTGLIPKAKKKNDRNYAERVYVFIYPLTEANVQTNINSFVRASKDITQKNKHLFKEWCLLKIDLTATGFVNKYRFFEDTEYRPKGPAAFTYDTINPRCISLESVHTVPDHIIDEAVNSNESK